MGSNNCNVSSKMENEKNFKRGVVGTLMSSMD